MAGRYCDLTEAINTYLGFYRGRLDPTRKALAEAAGDSFIDTMMSKWDRSSWVFGSMPRDAQNAATMFAAGEYINLEHSATHPDGSSEGFVLQDRARQMVTNIRAQGFVLNDNGEPVKATTGGNGFNVGIRF